jgi:hypothetical protein
MRRLSVDEFMFRGWKDICKFLQVKDKKTAKGRLERLDALNYEFGRPILFKEDYLTKQAEHLRRLPSEYISPESKIEDAIFARLPTYPRRKRQVKSLYGTIDILILDKPPIIIEVKDKPTLSNIQRAIGQLLLYRMDRPNASLYVACGEKVPKKYLLALNALGIKEWGKL